MIEVFKIVHGYYDPKGVPSYSQVHIVILERSVTCAALMIPSIILQYTCQTNWPLVVRNSFVGFLVNCNYISRLPIFRYNTCII